MKKYLHDPAKYDKIKFAGSSGSAGIGRQVRLRGVCRKAYGFKSHLPHQMNRGRNGEIASKTIQIRPLFYVHIAYLFLLILSKNRKQRKIDIIYSELESAFDEGYIVSGHL